MDSNPFLAHINIALPRILGLFDADKTSQSYGLGDRYYWAWGLIDFGNGTYQGVVNGLARLWHHQMWPYPTSQQDFINRIDSFYIGARNVTRKDGSLEEAFPNEGSFCVTALVAFDLLVALELLNREIDESTRERWLGIIKPMIEYIISDDETHAIISNHLATAVAALVRWHLLTDDNAAEERARYFLDRILANQSKEGWFKEYDGADPGYQSLCTYYLADIHQNRPDWNLEAALHNSIQYLWHFAHPDGSFGGLYGSRCTRFYYPAGISVLSETMPEAAALAAFMAESIANNRVVSLSSIDESNLIPMFNAYCWSASLWPNTRKFKVNDVLPALDQRPTRIYYEEAGHLIDRGSRHYTIVATSKGGAVYHFANKKLTVLDPGVVVANKKGQLGSSQAFDLRNDINIDSDGVQIKSAIYPMPKRLPKPLDFILLRILCISLFRFSSIRAWVKKKLVRLLITGAKPWPISNNRIVRLAHDISIVDHLDMSNDYKKVKISGKGFVPIHMASQGYWQIQDEEAVYDS